MIRTLDRRGLRASVASARAEADLPLLLALKQDVERLVRVDARRALAVATVMQRLEPRVADPRAGVLVRRAHAESFLFLGRYADARDAYRETIRLYRASGDTCEEARATVGLIATLMYLSRSDEALRLARRAERLLRHHGERAYLGRLYMNRGNIHYQRDRYRAALADYDRARTLLAATDGSSELVVGLEMNEGVICTNLDEMDRAEALLTSAIDRARSAGWRSLAAQGEFDLATVYFMQSRYQEALATLGRAAGVFEEEDKSLAAIADATRAEIYLRLNMSAEAAVSARAALAHCAAAGMRYDAALARNALGIALLREGASTEGRAQLRSARRHFAADGNAVRLAAIDVHLARADAGAGRWAAARRLAHGAETALRHAGLAVRADRARMMRAEIELLAGDAREAGRLLRASAAPRDRLGRFERAFLGGRIAEERGDRRRALAAYTRATAEAEAVRVSLAGEEHKVALAGFRAEAAARVAGVLLDRGFDRTAARVFDVVEGAKARALGDLLAQAPRRAADTPLARRLDDATRRLSWFVARQERLDADAPAARRAEIAREVESCERLVASLHRRTREEASPGTAGADRRGTLRAACVALEDDDVVIEYFAARGRLHALRLERTGARIVDCGTTLDDVDRIVARVAFHVDTARLGAGLLAAHASQLLAGATAALTDAHARLLGPLGAIAPDAHVTIVPHGALARLPFAALETPHGPLLARCRVGSAPSVTALMQLRARRARRGGRVLVGGHADAHAPGIRGEIDQVARTLRGLRPVVRRALTSQDFLRLAPSARIVHLATHGRFRDDNPLFSALRLADRWVHLYEILSLDMRADLVVLSGCETGAGRHYAGDEVVGLAGGFLARGTRELVVSLWPVDDPASGRLAARLHAGRMGGASTADALRRAAMEVRDAYPHPYYWAPFTLVGGA